MRGGTRPGIRCVPPTAAMPRSRSSCATRTGTGGRRARRGCARRPAGLASARCERRRHGPRPVPGRCRPGSPPGGRRLRPPALRGWAPARDKARTMWHGSPPTPVLGSASGLRPDRDRRDVGSCPRSGARMGRDRGEVERGTGEGVGFAQGGSAGHDGALGLARRSPRPALCRGHEYDWRQRVLI